MLISCIFLPNYRSVNPGASCDVTMYGSYMSEVGGPSYTRPTFSSTRVSHVQRVSSRRSVWSPPAGVWTDVSSSQLLRLFTNSAKLSPHFGAGGLFCPGCFLFPSHQRCNSGVVGGPPANFSHIHKCCNSAEPSDDCPKLWSRLVQTLATAAGG